MHNPRGKAHKTDGAERSMLGKASVSVSRGFPRYTEFKSGSEHVDVADFLAIHEVVNEGTAMQAACRKFGEGLEGARA